MRVAKFTSRMAGLCLLMIITQTAWAQGNSHVSPILKNHESDWINAVAFHPSQDIVALGVQGQTKLYSYPEGHIVGDAPGHSKYVQEVSIAPDGKSLYSIGWDGMICRWQLDHSGKVGSRPDNKQVLGTKKPQCLVIFPDGTQVATNGKDNSVDLFDGISLKPLGSLKGLKGTLTCLTLDPARNRLIAGDKTGNLAIWNTVDSKLIKKWGGHGKKITGLSVDYSTGEIISGDAKGEVKRWDPESFKNTRKVDFKEPVRGLRTSPDGRFIYLALKSGKIRLLDRELSDAAGFLTVNGRPNCLGIDVRGQYLACGTDENDLYVWDLLEIREMQIAYEIPSKLEIEVDFDDAGALVPNLALDGGEKVNLSCLVKNVGEGIAYDTHLKVTCDNRSLSFPANFDLGDILPGSKKTVAVPVSVDLEAKDGKANFKLHVAEKKQNDARSALGISVRYLPKPDLAITMIQLDDRNSGSTSGNGNGIPENNETVEVEIFLKNNGTGPAWRNRLVMTRHTPGVNALIDDVEIPTILGGQSASGRVRLQIPKTYSGDALAISVQVTDAITHNQAQRDQTWQAKQNVPVLVADWKVIQPLRNGRPGKLQLLLQNTGTLDAENINIQISNDQGLTISQPTARISRLTAGTSDPGLPFEVGIKSFFKAEEVAFQAVITQDNFSGTTSSRTFPIALSRPELVVMGLPSEMTVTRGENLYLDLSLENQGGLDAEDVTVVITSPDLSLSEEFPPLGLVASRSTRRLPQISWQVPMGRNTGPIQVSVVVEQKFFDSVNETFQPEVVSELIASRDIQASSPAGLIVAGGGGSSSGGSRGRTQGGLDLKFLNFQDKVNSSSFKLSFIAEGPQGIRGIRASLNGTPIYNLENSPADLEALRLGGGDQLRSEITLNYLRSDQPNELRIELTGEDGETKPFTKSISFEELSFSVAVGLDPNIDVNVPPRTGRNNPNGVALLIGVSKYQNLRSTIPDVEFARQDVLAVKETLISTLGFHEKNIIVLLDEFAAGFYDVAHQLGEQVVCFGHIRDLNLQQGAGVGVERGFPQLIGVHFTQTFVALQGQTFFTFGKDRFQQVHGAVDQLATVFAHQFGGRAVDVLQMLCEPARTFGLARPQHATVEGTHLFHAAQDAGEADAVVLGDAALPATFPFQCDQVQTLCDLVGHALQISIDRARHKGTGDGGLFQNMTGVMGRESFENTTHLAGQINDAGQILTGDFLAIALF